MDANQATDDWRIPDDFWAEIEWHEYVNTHLQPTRPA
jgi:hypothetical protein